MAMVFRNPFKSTTKSYKGIRKSSVYRRTPSIRFYNRPVRTTRYSGARRSFVPRSLGSPLALSERKYFDADRTSTAITSSAADWTGQEYDPATLNTLFCPVQGTAFNERVGRKVYVKSLRIKGTFSIAAQANQTAGDNANVLRWLCYIDRQTNGTQAQGEDVLSSGAGSNAVDMFQNAANFGRFRILTDRKIIMENQAISFDGTNIEQQGISKPFFYAKTFNPPMVVHFNATNGGTVADIVDNSFHIIANCTIANNVFIVYKSRVCFVDP